MIPTDYGQRNEHARAHHVGSPRASTATWQSDSNEYTSRFFARVILDPPAALLSSRIGAGDYVELSHVEEDCESLPPYKHVNILGYVLNGEKECVLVVLPKSGGIAVFVGKKSALAYLVLLRVNERAWSGGWNPKQHYGAMGVVEKGHDACTALVYARKTLKNSPVRALVEAKQRLNEEIQVLARLASHHHFVKSHATIKLGRTLSMVFEPVATCGDLSALPQHPFYQQCQYSRGYPQDTSSP